MRPSTFAAEEASQSYSVLFKLVDSLADVMRVRHLRNSCRQYLTNSTGYIGIVQQLRWYLSYYRQAKRSLEYRIYLLYDEAGQATAYGALQLRDSNLYVTECVAPEHRGMGYGTRILGELISIAHEEERSLIAEIWATNEHSIHLHERAGFVLESRTVKLGRELCRYSLPTSIRLGKGDYAAERSAGIAES